jgi:pimeloyl-ACP methyl ester carboxylesterase
MLTVQSLIVLFAFLLVGNVLCVCEDCGLSPDQMIRRWGYPGEAHTVIAEDGFALNMHRIPYGLNSSVAIFPRPAVIIAHGLLDSASGWLTNLPGQSLPFILADAGYDVWLANNRGNTWSLPSCNESKCWDFSVDECICFLIQFDLN